MKRFHWWTLLGVSGTGLAALMLGEAVRGQPEPRVTLPLPTAPLVSPQLPKGTVEPARPTPLPMPMPLVAPFAKPGDGLPTFPPIPATPKTGVTTPDVATTPISTDPVVPPSSVQPSSKPAAGNISLDVQPGRQQPAVTIEWVGPTMIRVNQPMACQIVVRNTSTSSAQNVVVRHRLGQGVACNGSEPIAAQETGELVWNLGTLAPQQARRIDLSLVSQTRGVLNCPATVTFTTVAAHQVQVREPQLAVKMNGPEKVIAGENVTLVFAVSNPGDGIAESVKVKTVLPDGFEHPRGKVLEFDVGNLAPKEVKTMQLVCVAKGSGAQKCQFVASGEGNLTATDGSQIEILMPKLDVAISGPKLRYLDRHAIYVLKVANPGSAPATNVEVQNLIPGGFKFHQANHGGQYQDATRLVSWNLGDIPPGQTKEIAVDLIPIETGDHRLVAHAKGARGLTSVTDVRTVVEGLPSLFIEVGHVDDPIEVGAETAYEIRVANTGTKTETNVEVTCILPEQLEFKGAKCSTTLKYRQEGRELIFEPLAKLAPKADVILRIQVKGIAPGDIRFRTRIRADGLKEPVMREESTRIYSDDAPVRPATSLPTESTKPAPSPFVPTPSPLPSPRVPLDPTPSTTVPTPAPLPTPTPLPLPTPSTLPTPTPLPLPAPSTTIPAPSAPVPAPSTPVPAPAPLPLPAPSTNVPLPMIPLPAPSGNPPAPPLPAPPSIPAPR